MVSDAKKLVGLEKIARILAEREAMQFASINKHMSEKRAQVSTLRAVLEQSYRSDVPLTVAEMQMANAQAGRAARELRGAEREVERIKPHYDAARRKAAKAFGRAEALQDLARMSPKKGSI